MTGHVRGVEPFPDKNQSANNVADASLPLLAVDNASVLDSRGSEPQKVIVIAKDNPALGEAKAKLVLVYGLEKTHLGCRRHVDAAAAKAGSYRVRAVLIKMKWNRPRHWASVP